MEFQLLLPFYYYSLVLLVLQSHLTCFSYAGQHLCAPDDASYLLQFKQGLTLDTSYHSCVDGEPQAKTLSWNVTVDCCKWDGVTCNESTGHVMGLDLSCSYLSGSIPESIGNLSRIRELDLSNNDFTNVPSTISKLNQLRYLDLSLNNFEGLILEFIGNHSRIRKLYLSHNNFTGNISSSILKLNQLSHLDLSFNNFTGNIPSSISKLNQLNSLHLSSNNFEGLIPDIFANFSVLTYLDFSSNNFSGSFPYSIANLTRLTSLKLQNNSLTGPLPSSVSGLQKLYRLDLSSNLLTGTAPPWLFLLPSLPELNVSTNQLSGKLPNELKSHLWLIDLSHNKLHGEIPDWMTSMDVGSLDLSHNFFTGFEKQVRWSKLQYLNLGNNFLQGSLHKSICDMIDLTILDLAHNNFSGTIPGCLGNLSSFFIVDLRMNNFHGEIPRFSAIDLLYLGLAGNQLGGQVPRSLVNCTRLEALDLGNNKINDTFPIWLEKLPSLQVLILKSNLFHGSIGDFKSQFSFPVLRIFDLSYNGFAGTLPSNLFRNFRGMVEVDEDKTGTKTGISDINASYYSYDVSLMIKGNDIDMTITLTMTSIDLSSNRFEGEIPHSIGSLHSLVLLNLSHNSFHGHIPAEIAKMNALESLDLSWNRLIGEIPNVLSNLNFLEVLNLSYNHLVGRIPLGKQFNTFSNDSYRGNPDLCGLPLSKECGTKNVSHESPFEQDHDDSFFARGFTWESVVIGYSCGMSFGLFLILLLEKPKWIVKHVDEIAQKIAEEIALKKRRRQRKRRQR